MSEPTLEQIWKAADDADTDIQIVEQLNRSATGGFHSAETAAAASAIHTELSKRLQTVSDPDTRLQISRAARKHFREVAAENTEKYVTDQIESHFERWRALSLYKSGHAKRPENSRYSLQEIADYKETAPVTQSATPSVEEEI